MQFIEIQEEGYVYLIHVYYYYGREKPRSLKIVHPCEAGAGPSGSYKAHHLTQFSTFLFDVSLVFIVYCKLVFV